MQRPFYPLFAIVFCATLAGCAASRPQSAASRPADSPDPHRGMLIVNDRDLMETFETAAGELCDRAAQTTMQQLGSELDQPPAVPAGQWPAMRVDAWSPGELYAQRLRGVMLVMRMYKCDRCSRWHMNSEGTAFLVRGDGLAVTCRHVLESESNQNDNDVLMCGDWRGHVYPVRRVVASSLGCDVALIALDMDAARFLPDPERPLPIPLREDPLVGDPISIISHPHHNHYLLTRGIVSRLGLKYSGINGDLKSMKDIAVPYLNVTAEYGVGSSGAPVMDDAGNAVGVVVSTFGVASDHDNKSDVQMVIRFCTPATVLRAMVEDSPVGAP